MNVYVVIFSILAIVVLAWNIRSGFHHGFAQTISSLLAVAAAVFVLVLLAGLSGKMQDGSLTGTVLGFLMLAVFLILYAIFRVILRAINVLVKLPLIRWLDQGLGIVAGFFRGALVLYVTEFLLRNYLLS